MWLVIALITNVTVGIRGAGVADSMAASRQANADHKSEARDQLNKQPAQANGLTVRFDAQAEPSSQSVFSSATASSLASSFENSSSTIQPSATSSTNSNLSTISSAPQNHQLHQPSTRSNFSACGTCHHRLPAVAIPVLSPHVTWRHHSISDPIRHPVHTNTFKDYIFACASYATICSHHQTKIAPVSCEISGSVSCRLKRSNGTVVPIQAGGVSSAVVQ